MKKPAPLNPRLTPSQIALVTLGRGLIAAQIALAEKRGYIQRVQEVEARAAASVETEPMSDGIEKLQRVLAYSPEREAGQVLDAISPELLDKILGKPEVPREDGFR